MAYRCQSCGHFAGLDDPELEEEDSEYDGTTLTVIIEASYPSTCCGVVVATASYEALGEGEVTHGEKCSFAGMPNEADYTIDVTSMEATDRFQDKDAKGKTIPYRYQRHYYGVVVTATVRCDECQAEEVLTASDESGPPDES